MINIETNSGQTCMICDKGKEKGIHLFNSFICYDCEMELVNTDTDQERYKYYIEKMRKLTETAILF